MIGIRSVVGAAALAGAFALPGVALADTVPSAIGTITAEQYLGTYCDDLGAHVRVTVDAGLAGTTYSATGIGRFSGTSTFVTDSSGAGHVDLHNVRTAAGPGVGVTQVTVRAGGTTVTVPATINCPGQQGG